MIINAVQVSEITGIAYNVVLNHFRSGKLPGKCSPGLGNNRKWYTDTKYIIPYAIKVNKTGRAKMYPLKIIEAEIGRFIEADEERKAQEYISPDKDLYL